MPLFAKIPIDKKQLEAAISCLERQTSAEFRIFIERKIPSKLTALSVYERARSEEHTSELQSPDNLVCRLLLEKKKHV